MIETVPDQGVRFPEDNQPLVLVPVTAEDVARRSMRMRLYVGASMVAILCVAGLMYKRYMDPRDARDSFDAGTRSYKIARYNQAILSFDRAIALKPDLVDAYLMRGRAYVGDAEPERALQDFTRVIELRPSDPTGWVERGAAYLEINKFQEAIADSTRAIEVGPKLAAAYNLRGSALRKSGDSKKALEDFDRALELAPNADNYYQRGATYQRLGQHKQAIADFSHVIEMIPDLGNAYFARAESRRAMGDLAGAKQDHTQARILDGR